MNCLQKELWYTSTNLDYRISKTIQPTLSTSSRKPLTIQNVELKAEEETREEGNIQRSNFQENSVSAFFFIAIKPLNYPFSKCKKGKII